MTSARDRFIDLLRTSVRDGTFVKLTLGKHRGADATLRNLFVRPVMLKAGPHLTFVWRHLTRDITKNHRSDEALAQIESLLGPDFLDAHLFTPLQTVQLECSPDGVARLSTKTAAEAPPPAGSHDRAKNRPLPANTDWLRALGITNDQGRPREGMAAKYRQIQKFVEILGALAAEAGFDDGRELRIADMGSGKGYLTFATAAYFAPRAEVTGIEARADLVTLCNEAAAASGLRHLLFKTGHINATPTGPLDVLIALHACDTATDDALAQGISSGASLLVVSPCCQKELRPQLTAPAVLAEALRHGIFQERQAEFVTDALRAQLLEWAGYRTKVFEFVSTEHTAKNLLIAAIKTHTPGDEQRARRLREFAAFYGIRTQRLAVHLGCPLT
jgi:hypothetical protein